MKKGKIKVISLLLLLSMVSWALCGCQSRVHYADVPEKYVKTLDYHDGFVIVQLTDIHWNTGACIGNDEYGSKAYIKKLINETKAKFGGVDLIEVTGDIFCLANATEVSMFLDTMTEIGIPYAVTWGNHDRQGKYNPNWISQKFMDAPCSLYTEIDNDDVHERGNYVVELVKDGQTAWQIFNIDSGADYRAGASDIGLDYDWIRQDQIDWFEFMHKRAGDSVPVLCYYHIPQLEFEEGFEAIKANTPGYKQKYYKKEGISCSANAVSLNPVFVRNNVKGAFIGHDHSNDWTFTNPDGITYGFGVKTDTELYSTVINSDPVEEDQIICGDISGEFPLTGASVVRLLNDSGDFELYHLYMSKDSNGSAPIWEEY